MKRSSSKLISKAGSVRNINKQAYKFRFSLQVETVNKLLGSSEVVVTWERGAKVLSTKPARIDKSTRTANFGNELLEQEVTLFKRKKEGSSFEDKVFRLTTRQGNEKGKVMGRIDINFADYIEIPTFSKRIAAALSNGGQIVMRVQSTYLGEAKRKGKNSSLGSSSVTSSHIDVSSGPDEDTTKRDEDLHDLDIPEMESDFPPTAPSAPISKSSSSNAARYTSSSSVTHDSMNDNTSNVPPRKKGQGAVVPPVSNEHRTRPSANGRRSPVNTEGSTRPGASRTELERLRKENRELRRKNEDLSDRNAELEYRLSRGGSADSASLEEENASLRNEVTDLQHQLSREPVYADVVKELREAKMALAILTLERDELTRQLRQQRK